MLNHKCLCYHPSLHLIKCDLRVRDTQINSVAICTITRGNRDDIYEAKILLLGH